MAGEVLSYPRAAVAGDYARALAGAGAAGAVCLGLASPLAVRAVIAAIGVLFCAHGWATRGRQRLRLELEPEALLLGPRGARLRWDRLHRLSLRYYSTRRDRRNGWWQLKLEAEGGVRLKVDSRLRGFDALLERAVEAASARGLEVGAATRANLQHLGLAVPGGAQAG